jgi:hypothetical protein
MGLVYVMPAQSYPEGTRLPMYWNVPRPTTYADYQANLRKGYLVGNPEFATPTLPRITAPVIPEFPKMQRQSDFRPSDPLPSFSP